MSMLTPHASSAYISPFYEDLQYNIDCFNPYLYPNYPSFQTYSSHDDHNSYQLHSHGAFKNIEGSKPRRRKLNRRSTRFASGKISTKSQAFEEENPSWTQNNLAVSQQISSFADVPMDSEDCSIEKENKDPNQEFSCISNYSTGMSDITKSWSDEIERSCVSQKKDSEDSNESHTVILEVTLENETGCETVVIYKEEEDLEAFLGDVCQRNNIEGRMALLFQINVLQTLRDMYPQEESFETLLDKLLEMNYHLIMDELNQESCGGDESILGSRFTAESGSGVSV